MLATRAGAAADATNRQRECLGAVPHRFSTFEVHQPEFNNQLGRIKQYAASRKRRVANWHRDALIAMDNRPTRVLAAEFKISTGRIRQIRRTHL